MGGVGTAAARSPPARWVAKDESNHTALGDAWPDGAQGGAEFCAEDRLCPQLSLTVGGDVFMAAEGPTGWHNSWGHSALPLPLSDSQRSH